MKVRLGNCGVHVVYSHILRDYYVLLSDTQRVENFDFTYLVQFISVVSGMRVNLVSIHLICE